MPGRGPRLTSVFVLGIALVPAGTGQAAAQGGSWTRAMSNDMLRSEIADDTRRLDNCQLTLDIWRTYERRLRDGTLVAVPGDRETVFMTRTALRGSLQRHVMRTIIARFAASGDFDALRGLADAALINSMAAQLEREVIAKSNEYADKRIAMVAEIEADIQKLEARLESYESELRRRAIAAARAEGGEAPAEDRRLAEVRGLSARRRALGEELERTRLAGAWVADHHFQVGTLIGNSRTWDALNAVEVLMRDYARCYATWNTDREAVAAAARAGRYPTPGDRIGGPQ